jgi:membrane protein DedA with SNARE-associated domain
MDSDLPFSMKEFFGSIAYAWLATAVGWVGYENWGWPFWLPIAHIYALAIVLPIFVGVREAIRDRRQAREEAGVHRIASQSPPSGRAAA